MLVVWNDGSSTQSKRGGSRDEIYFEQNCSLENIFTSPLSVFQGISPCYEIVEQNAESKTFHTGLLQY